MELMFPKLRKNEEKSKGKILIFSIAHGALGV
jgi:hypothetical protein